MNKEWSTLQKTMQSQLKKKDTFDEGINTLCYLRKILMNQILSWQESLSLDDFAIMPYKNAHGYHNKTIAYSLYHIFRIEDIVCQNLIKKEDDTFFCQRYDQRLNINIITTGNELQAKEIVDFSIQMNKDELYSYIQEVVAKTNEF